MSRSADFGISHFIDAYRADAAVGLSGTLGYMAPEQARVEPDADHRVDVFALGGVLKFLLTGVGPYGDRPTPEDYLQAAKEGNPRVQPRQGPSGFGTELGQLGISLCINGKPR